MMEYGLCSNCAKAEYCTFRNNPGFCKRFCEEYETVSLPAMPATMPSQEIIIRPSDKVRGLCRNCGNYPKCGFPKPLSGIWHCEEYY